MLNSPLRYPGGKAKLYPFFVELIKENGLFGVEYCEPYAGGAGLAIQLLANGFVEKVSINDIDRSIYAFWYSALNNTGRLCKLIEETPITVEEWRKQKDIWSKGGRDILRLGFATYFLNRTNRSGIIDGAGPIGGYGQSGPWKIDVRLSKGAQIENLHQLSKFSNQFEIHNEDAMRFFRSKKKNQNLLVYLDPPYFVKGQKLYKNFYEPKDHLIIARELKASRKLKWVVTYDDVPQIRDAYASFSPTTYRLNYSAGDKGLGSEVIYVSDSLSVPRIAGFDGKRSTSL